MGVRVGGRVGPISASAPLTPRRRANESGGGAGAFIAFVIAIVLPFILFGIAVFFAGTWLLVLLGACINNKRMIPVALAVIGGFVGLMALLVGLFGGWVAVYVFTLGIDTAVLVEVVRGMIKEHREKKAKAAEQDAIEAAEAADAAYTYAI